VVVHFTGPQKPSGPIVAGPEGVHYLVTHDLGDSCAEWMPKGRDGLDPGSRTVRTVRVSGLRLRRRAVDYPEISELLPHNGTDVSMIYTSADLLALRFPPPVHGTILTLGGKQDD